MKYYYNKTLDNYKSFDFIIFIKRLYNSRSKYINKNKNNNKSINFVIFIKYLYNCRSKCIGKNSKNSDSKSKVATIFPIIFIKCLT